MYMKRDLWRGSKPFFLVNIFFFWSIFFIHDLKGYLEEGTSKFADNNKLNEEQTPQTGPKRWPYAVSQPCRKTGLPFLLSLLPIFRVTLKRGDLSDNRVSAHLKGTVWLLLLLVHYENFYKRASIMLGIRFQ